MAPLDPRYLSQLARGRVIQHDEFCLRCRYNLVGLRSNQRCPECGTPIDFERAWREDAGSYGRPVVYKDPGPFFDAPAGYIVWLTRAFSVLTVSGAGLLAGFVGLLLVPHPLAAALPLAASVTWAWACMVITLRRRIALPKNIDTRQEWRTLRHTVRWTQAGWFVLALVALAVVWPGLLPPPACPAPPQRLAVVAAGFAAGAGAGAGAAALWVLLSNLAFWIGDTPLASRLREAAWVQAGALTLGLPTLATGALWAMLRGVLNWNDLGMVLAAAASAASIAAMLFPAWCLWRVGRTASLIRQHLREGGALPPPGRPRG